MGSDLIDTNTSYTRLRDQKYHYLDRLDMGVAASPKARNALGDRPHGKITERARKTGSVRQIAVAL